MKVIEIDEPVFKTLTVFLYDCDHNDLVKYLKKHGDLEVSSEQWEHADGSAVYPPDIPFRLIWLRSFKNKPEDLGRLIHEVFHHVVRICDWKGIPIEEYKNCDETAAYLSDFYVRKFLEEWKKKKK